MRGYVISCSGHHPEQTHIAERIQRLLIRAGCEVERIDGQTEEELGTKLQRLSLDVRDFAITLDLAGFTLRTQMNNLAYNTFPVRMLHLIFGRQKQYPAALAGRINFSMFFFLEDAGEARRFQEQYPHADNVICCAKLAELRDEDKAWKVLQYMLEQAQLWQT